MNKSELDGNFDPTLQCYLEALDLAYTRLRNELYNPDQKDDDPHLIGASSNFEAIKIEILDFKKTWHLARRRLT